MKRFIKTALTAVLAVAAVACTRDLEPLKENINGTIDLSFTGVINGYTPQEETKAEAQTVVRIMWNGDETVYVYDGTKKLGFLTASIEGTDGTYAKLSGTISETTATTLTFVYSPQFSEAPDVTDGKISLGLSTQDKEEIPFLIYATLPKAQAPATFSNDVVQFNLATSVFKCNCTGLSVDGEISQAAIKGVNTKCELTLSNNGAPQVSGSTPGTITRTAGFTKADQRAIFSVALPETAASTERNILVHQNSKVFGAPFSAIAFAVNKSYNTVYQLGEYVAPPDGILPGEFTVVDEGGNVKKVHFSRGNLYYDGSKFNFEANQYDSTPATGGDWDANHVSHFFWSKTESVAYAKNYSDGNVSDSDVFFTNADVETAKTDFTVSGVAGKYRTLSIAEWQYLFAYTESGANTATDSPRYNLQKYGVTVCGKANCIVLLPDNWVWDTSTVGPDWQSGGYPETQTNGEVTWEVMEKAGAVCLPAASGRVESEVVNNVGELGGYWSSSSASDENAYIVSFESDYVNLDEPVSRPCGYSVRLVTDASDGYAPAVKVESVTLNKSEIAIEAGTTETLVATVVPAEATHKEVNWSSSKPSVATVDSNGEVTGVAAGSAIITATTASGNFTAVCLVTVTGPNVIGLRVA